MKKIQTGISQHLAVPMEPIVPSQVDAISQNYNEARTVNAAQSAAFEEGAGGFLTVDLLLEAI